MLGAVLGCLAAIGCSSRAPETTAPRETADALYRFDDHFASAAVTAPKAAPVVRMAEPVVWDFNDRKITWDLVRGRLGFKPGQLIVKGDGSTPVIVSPVKPATDWSRYEAILIRMIAERGREIKIKLGGRELKQELAPPMEWRVYRFDLKLEGSTYVRPLAIMPTDDLYAPVAIDFIELLPRKTQFASAAGRATIGKREEYRNAIFARAPSSLAYQVSLPERPLLHFGLGIASQQPVRFRVSTSNTELFSKTVTDPDVWEDIEVDLSAYAGQSTKLVFETSSEAPDAVGFWANPILTSRMPKARPNVLLYVVCTLRPDHTSLYGYHKDTTPFLKRLAASAVVFDDAQAPAPWTKPSVGSLMTSLPAYAHGMVEDTDTIPKGAATLAEQLRAAGYVTASIVANPFAGRTSGLDRGFDYVLEYPVVQRYRTDAVDRGTDSAAINRAIVPWLERHRQGPFFLYVQSTDPHAPYRPPADFEARFAKPAETAQFNGAYAKLRDIRAYGGGATVTEAEMRSKGIQPAAYMRQAVERYDGEIAHNDASIESLLGKMKEAGVLENTLAVIASDHGEEFWEHGFGAHGHSLYNELIRCVLLMWNQRLLPSPRRVSEPVQLIDVMPTVLELVGAKTPPAAQGQSLVTLLKGLAFTRNGAVTASKLALPRAKPRGGVPENLTNTFARIDGSWKLIYRDQAGRAGLKEVELYDRRTDREDRHDVAASRADITGKLKLEIVQWIEAQKLVRKQLGPGGKSTLDRETLERLRSLGYLGGAAEKER